MAIGLFMDGVTVGRALVDVPVRCLAEDRALFAAFHDDAFRCANSDALVIFFERSAAVLRGKGRGGEEREGKGRETKEDGSDKLASFL